MITSLFLEKLAAYVPTPVAHWVYKQPDLSAEPTARRFPGVILFSDISGFTALSELLSEVDASGSDEFFYLATTGAEELTYLINQYFTEMIQISEAYHGQVVKFSGDALTILFPAEEVSMAMAVRRAGECALAMQAKMSEFAMMVTSRGQASLSMTVGIGAGLILECNIGGELGRWEYMVAGDPLVQMAMAERLAKPGQIVLSSPAWQEAQAFFVGTEIENGQGCIRLIEVIHPLPRLEPAILDWSQLDPQQRQKAAQALERYIPGAIKARLAEQSDWLAEIRRMTIVFVGIGGFDYEAASAGEQLQNFLRMTQPLIDRFGGSLNKVAVDDKGTVLLILFGVPPSSHEDNPTRAVAFALNLQNVAQAQGLRMTIGITEGTMFAGPVGAPKRREYTVIGDEVNLAARFMQYGRAGAIIISDRIKERAGPHFIIESLGQIVVKGKAQTQAAYLVKGQQGHQEEFVMRYLLQEEPLIGRQTELEQIRRIAAKAQKGWLQLLFLEAELGLGKSRLASEMLREWIMGGAVGYGGKCISYNRQIPYQVWREVLVAIYGLTPALSPQQQLARLAIGIADLEDPPGQPNYWANRLPLLADVLGLEAPDNEITQTISGQLRRNNTFAIIEAVLRREAKRRPLMILLEDVHWADELSLSLVTYLARNMIDVPLLLVLVHRPMVSADKELLAEIYDLPYAHQIVLDPLLPQESLELIEILFKDRAVTEEVKQILLSRGQGNPFFIQEIAGAILNVLDRQTGSLTNLREALNLPDTVQDVILTRIDSLAEAEKLTLKIASVIGTRFPRPLLSAVHPVGYSDTVLSSQLSKLENEKLIRLETPAPKWEYEFHNVIVQEVAYEGLLSAQRRQLHSAVGELLQNLAPDEIERLAFHYSRSNEWQKALYYLEAAAEKARREYANYAAINYYSEILNLIAYPSSNKSGENMISTRYWDVLLERAKLYNLIGQQDDELEDLGTLGILSEALNDNYRRALAARQWAHLYETIGDYDSSLAILERSVQLAEEAGAEKLVGEGYNQWGKLLYLRQEYKVAHEYLQNALLIAQKHQDRHLQADSLNSLGIVARYQMDYEVALYFFQEAIDLWRTLNHQVGLGNSLCNMGQVYYEMGHYSSTLSCYQEATGLHQMIGDRAGEALAHLFSGQVQRSLGNYATAQALLTESLTTYRSIRDRRYEAYNLYHLGFLYYRLAEPDVAIGLLEEALLILRELNDPWALSNALTYYGWILTDQNKIEEAEQAFEEALKIKGEAQQDRATAEDLAHLGYLALARHELKRADGYIRRSLNLIESEGVMGIEHPGKVYLIAYHVLQANQNFEQAQAVLNQGYHYLMEQLEQIDDPVLAHNYLQNIPEHKALQRLATGTVQPPDNVQSVEK
jgi:predicted ATPase/class 3 adenylate cyclase